MKGDISFIRYFFLWIFGVSFGFIEASVVVYLRNSLDLESDNIFPVLVDLSPIQSWLMGLEIKRELFTLVLMLIPAILVSQRNFLRFLAYAIIFGVWDLSYYLFLKLFLDWPETLMSYDILFLFPTFWIAPVICPIAISITLISFSSIIIYSNRDHKIRLPSVFQWLLLLVGGIIVFYSFIAERAYYLAGGIPPQFPWDYFFSGYLLSLVGVLLYSFQLWKTKRMRFG